MKRSSLSRSRVKVLVLLLFVLSFNAFSQGTVSSIHRADQVMVEVPDPEIRKQFVRNERVLITSGSKNVLVAIGRVRDEEVGTEGLVKVEIVELVRDYLIMPGDTVEVLSAKILKERKIPGFNSITLAKGKNIPAEYKELATFGVFNSEGHALGESEVLLSPFQLQYGVTDDLTLKAVNTLWFDGYANMGLKYGVYQDKWAKITLNGLGAYKLQRQDWIAQFGGVLTIPSNSKFQKHFMFTATLDQQSDVAKKTKDLDLFQDSDIRSIMEYVADDWNRILFGPVYNVELQTFGGTLSYMWIWKTFHLSLGIATRDFSNLKFGSDGYYYVFDVYWRF